MLALRKWKSLPSTSTAASLSDLPEDILVSILKRLPVKSILRFKCVSKDWLSLLSTPHFISMHRQATSNNPLNYSLIVHTFHDDDKISVFDVNSNETEPISLVLPSPVLSKKMYIVGCVNGLVCLSCLPPQNMIILWNPAMNQYKTISRPVDDTRISLLGFAYDYVNDDHKIIAIDSLKEIPSLIPELLSRAAAEVYSSNLDSWERVQLDFRFLAAFDTSKVTVKGTPYWSALLIQESNEDDVIQVLVCYDMQNGLFKHVSVPKLAQYDGHGKIYRRFMEWKGNLGVLVTYPLSQDHFIDILVYDEIGMSWNQISTHGPIGLKMERPIQCPDWVILEKYLGREVVLCDPVTNGIKFFCIPGAHGDNFETFRYTESLVTIKGMEQVKSKSKTQSSLAFFFKRLARVEIAVRLLVMLVNLVVSARLLLVHGYSSQVLMAASVVVLSLVRLTCLCYRRSQVVYDTIHSQDEDFLCKHWLKEELVL